MKRKMLLSVMIISSLLSLPLYAKGETLLVQTRNDYGYVYFHQFTLNEGFYSVCSGYDQTCPSQTYVKIDAMNTYTFNLFATNAPAVITDSCKNKSFKVKPNNNKTIFIYYRSKKAKEMEIFCNFED